MSEHSVRIEWTRRTDSFDYEGFDRHHEWLFPGGTRVEASAAPEYRGDPHCVNPEEAFAAALSSCHMLTFLALAARRRFTVDRYEDEAVATLARNEEGKQAVTRVRLRPSVAFGGERRPDAAELEKLHERAHAGCFIASSVRTEVAVEPRDVG